MNRYIKMGALVFILLGVLAGCTTAQQTFYSYKVDSYYIGQSKEQFAASHVISCGDYLVEFNTKVKIDTKGISDAEEGIIKLVGQTVTYDTVSVYLLMPNGQYAEFDSFSAAGKLLKKGLMADKEQGIKRGATTDTATQTTALPVPPTFTNPKDTVINNVPCYYSDVVRIKNTLLDTVGMRYFLVKKQAFSSVYKMLGLKWKSNDYTIVGLQQYMYANGEGYIEKIANLRPLTAAERKICESLIEKAGLPLPK